MTKHEELKQNVFNAEKSLEEAKRILLEYEASPEMNTFEAVDNAICKICDKLLSKAAEDCEGSYNCGNDEYSQDFYVDNEKYTIKVQMDYGRHNKTYYYVCSSSFSMKKEGGEWEEFDY